jgi:CRP-like cAMP-binding protein
MIPNQLLTFIKTTHPSVTDYGASIIADNFDFIELRKHAFVLTAGNICTDYIFLQSGIMRTFTIDSNGGDVTTNFFFAPSMVFEVSSYFQKKPSLENIQYVSDCQAWVGNYDAFQNLFHSLPEFREFGRAILVKGFVDLKERMLKTISLKAEARYELLLKTNPQVFQHVPLKHIASYLGITDTSLSRIRKEFLKR